MYHPARGKNPRRILRRPCERFLAGKILNLSSTKFPNQISRKSTIASSNKATYAQGSVLGEETMEENQGENGGKGSRKFWNSVEIAAAVLSFLQVSEDPVVGVNQSGGRFHARLVEALVKKPLFLFSSFNQCIVWAVLNNNRSERSSWYLWPEQQGHIQYRFVHDKFELLLSNRQ